MMKQSDQFTFSFDMDGIACDYEREIEVIEVKPDISNDSHVFDIYIDDDLYNDDTKLEEIDSVLRDENNDIELIINFINNQTREITKVTLN